MIRSVIDGVLAVVIAVLVGMALAFGLGYVGLTDTPWWRLGPWLAGVGLLGSWQQQVSSSVGAGWTVTATGAPLLVTLIVAWFVGMRARRGTWMGAPLAAVGAATGSALLVLASRDTSTVANAAGSVTVVEGLTWWVPLGAAALVAGAWLLNTVGLTWWRSGRGVATGLLVWLGLVLTAAVAAGLVYLTSSTAVGIAVAALYPLAGTLALLGLAGAPVQASLTRLTPEALDVSTWQQGPLYAVGGAAAALVLAAVVGLILRLLRHRSTWLGAVTVTPALAAFLAWAMSSRVAVPSGFGAGSQVVIEPWWAAVAAAVLGCVARLCAGAPRDAKPRTARQSPPADPTDSLLTEVDSAVRGA